MGGGGPPPPPKRQPYSWEKETSMYHRNIAFNKAVEASRLSYEAAIVVKTLADMLVPITDRQLREMIDFHFKVVAEYRRAQVIYVATVETFFEVDALVKASIDKLKMIQNVGETYLDEYDQHTLKYITDRITDIYKHQNTLQKLMTEGNGELENIRLLYNGSNRTRTEQEIEEEYNRLYNSIQVKCSRAEQILTEIQGWIAEMKTRINDDSLLTMVVQSKGSMLSGVSAASANLRSANADIQNRHTENIDSLMKELEKRNRWYAFYKKQADEVENRNNVVINPALFIRLLNWAKHSHLMSIYSALHALSASIFAYRDRNNV